MFGKPKPKTEDTYFVELAKLELDPILVGKVKTAILDCGEWKDSEEWRISTWTDFSIKVIEKNGKQWFEVRVTCDHEFFCHTPTVERAVEMLWLYRNTIIKMFYQLGWPSWISLTQHPDRAT